MKKTSQFSFFKTCLYDWNINDIILKYMHSCYSFILFYLLFFFVLQNRNNSSLPQVRTSCLHLLWCIQKYICILYWIHVSHRGLYKQCACIAVAPSNVILMLIVNSLATQVNRNFYNLSVLCSWEKELTFL